MWEFTLVDGLNFSTNGKDIITFYCVDKTTGEICKNFGFDVGQPLQFPPIHEHHKDIGLGKINRIYYFKNMNLVCYEFEFSGNHYIIEFDGQSERLKIKFFYKKVRNRNIVCFLKLKKNDLILEDSFLYITDGTNLNKQKIKVSLPEPDLSLREALRQCVYTNTVRDKTGDLYISVNRAWIKMMGKMFNYDENFTGPLVFIWDCAFNSLIASLVDLNLAESNLRFLFHNFEENGFLRQLRVGDKFNNLTGLPIVSYIVMKIYKMHKNYNFIKWIYPKLLKWHLWIKKNRDKNRNGLLEWGYEEKGKGIELKSKEAPWYESGLDDSPMWENIEVDESLRCFKMDCIDLTSIFALDCLSLAEMASILKRNNEKDFLLTEYNELKNLINRYMWDKENKVYTNKSWTGIFSKEISPTSFFPMISNIPTKEMSTQLIKKLLDEDIFWGDLVIPSINKKSNYYTPDGDYWRGRIWPPLNFIVFEGLKNYNGRVAFELSEKSKKIFMKEWLSHGHVHENYSALTGNGEPQGNNYARSCPFYTWGGLMILLELSRETDF